MFGREEKKLRIIILTILIASLSFMLFYYRSIVNSNLESESELLLCNIGNNYIADIKSEINKFTSISELLANNIEKNIDDNQFDKEIKAILKDLIYQNQRLRIIDLEIFSNTNVSDSTQLSLADNSNSESIRFEKSKSGISERNQIPEYKSQKMQVAIEKAKLNDQTTLLDPEVIQDEGEAETVVPVFTSIYRGKQLLGYLITYISTSWLSENNYIQSNNIDFTETFVTSPDNSIISINGNKEMINEPLDKICSSCGELLGNKGQAYNLSDADNFITLCIPWQPSQNNAYWNICVRAPKKQIFSHLGSNNISQFIIVFLILLLSSILIFIFFKRYNRTLSENENYAQNILTGQNKNAEIDGTNNSSTSTDRLKLSLSNISKSLNNLVKINKAALEGNFDTEIENGFKNHDAYKTTKELHQKFKTTIHQFKDEKIKLEHFKQETEGLAKINQVLKLHHKDLQLLSVNVIHTLVDLLKIEMGAVFLVKTEDGKQILDLSVSYAYSENRFQKRSFNFGESLVGACAAEKRTIFLKKVPEDYLKIMSGLGLASPKSILIVPLIFENNALGVIELGSLNDFDDNMISFAEKAAETISNTLSMAEINVKALELLEQTEHQKMELEKRDQQMFEAINELKNLQTRTALSEAAIRAKLEAMNNTLMMVEYTSRGIVLDANYKYQNTMNFSREEIIGMDVLDLLKESERAELIKIINTVKNGNVYEGVIKRHTRQGDEKWLIATYTPVYNEKNEVENILFYATDITRLRKNESQLKIKIQELTRQIEELGSK